MSRYPRSALVQVGGPGPAVRASGSPRVGRAAGMAPSGAEGRGYVLVRALTRACGAGLRAGPAPAGGPEGHDMGVGVLGRWKRPFDFPIL